MKSTQKQDNFFFNAGLILFLCMLIAGALVRFCTSETVSDIYSHRLNYRGANLYVRPWIGWIVYALGYIISFGGFFIILREFVIFFFIGDDKESVQIKCPSCKREKEISEYGRYKCTKCGQKFIVGSDGKISKI